MHVQCVEEERWRYTVREGMYTCVFEKERWNGILREDDDRVPLRFSLFRERKSSPLSCGPESETRREISFPRGKRRWRCGSSAKFAYGLVRGALSLGSTLPFDLCHAQVVFAQSQPCRRRLPTELGRHGGERKKTRVSLSLPLLQISQRNERRNCQWKTHQPCPFRRITLPTQLILTSRSAHAGGHPRPPEE